MEFENHGLFSAPGKKRARFSNSVKKRGFESFSMFFPSSTSHLDYYCAFPIFFRIVLFWIPEVPLEYLYGLEKHLPRMKEFKP